MFVWVDPLDNYIILFHFFSWISIFFQFNSTSILWKIYVHNIFYRNLLNIFSIPIHQHKICVLNDVNEPQIRKKQKSSLPSIDKRTVASGISSQELLADGHFWSVRLKALSYLSASRRLPNCRKMAEWARGNIKILPPVSW